MKKLRTVIITWVALSLVNELYNQSREIEKLKTQISHQDKILETLIAFEMPDQHGHHKHPSWLGSALNKLGIQWEFERITKQL